MRKPCLQMERDHMRNLGLFILLLTWALPARAAVYFDSDFEACAVGTGNDFPCDGWADHSEFINEPNHNKLEASMEFALTGTKSVKATWCCPNGGIDSPLLDRYYAKTDNIFVRFAVRVTPGFVTSTNNSTKMFRYTSTDGYPVLSIGRYSGKYSFACEGCYARGTYIFVTSIPMSTTSWDQIESEFTMNTPGQSNGIHRIWINGVLVMEELNQQQRGPTPTSVNGQGLITRSTRQFDAIQLIIKRGQGSMFFDRIAVGNTRIGMTSGGTPPDTQSPSVPAGLGAQAVSSSQINLTWSASTDNVGVTGYKIFRSGTQIATTSGTSYSNTAISASTAYSYTIAAYDAAGNTSAQSSAASATTQAPPTASTTTLVAHYKFDETSGTSAADASGNGFTATLGNYATSGWTAGKIGGALNFDGVSNYVSAGAPAALNNLTRYTIAAWIKPDTYGQGSLGRIMDKRATGGGWTVFVCGSGTGLCTGNIFLRQSFSVAEGGWGAPVNSITLGTWQHVAVTYDNTSAANRPVFYVNGAVVATNVDTTPSGSASPDAASILAIGHAGQTRNFDGAIDDVRLYNRILSAAEIQALANVAPPAKPKNLRMP